MAANGDVDDKTRTIQHFLLNAPPGEFKEVLADIKTIVGDDTVIQACGRTIVQYHKEQFTPVSVDSAHHQCLLTAFNSLPDGRFLDPRSKTSFRLNPTRCEATDVRPADVDKSLENWREALEREVGTYFNNFYSKDDNRGSEQAGAFGVFAYAEADGQVSLVVCIESHHYQPTNYWSGKWRSQWTVRFDPTAGADSADAIGSLRLNVHYYEDGNIQLLSNKDCKGFVSVMNPAALAKDLLHLMQKDETTYQTAITDNYHTMSNETFKTLRRQLPITKNKMNWAQTAAYKVGQELPKTQ